MLHTDCHTFSYYQMSHGDSSESEQSDIIQRSITLHKSKLDTWAGAPDTSEFGSRDHNQIS